MLRGVCGTRPALLPAGLLSQSLEFSSPADNYTVCEGDNATLRYSARGLGFSSLTHRAGR